MVQFTDALFVALLAIASSVQAAPVALNKRIQQTTIDAVTPWENACDAAGGGLQCNPIAVTAASTLLAAAGNCDQQNSADAMVTLAKTLNNNAQMITLAQIFAQQPRNSPTSQAVQYCETAPQNAELNGFFQCQFEGSDQTTFVGGVAVGVLTTPLNPAGSCPANPTGPIANGVQLNTLVTSPGTPSGSSGAAAAAAPPPAASSSVAAAPAASSAAAADNSAATGAAATSSSSTSASGFALANGQAAQALNAQFATLTTSSSCTAGQDACVNGGFAQCVNGAFVVTQCAGGEVCAALPLVNSPGTSVTCTTTADADSRIAATGATGGLTGDGSTTAASAPAAPAVASSPAAAAPAATAAANNSAAASTSTSTSSFALSNGQAAQALNAQFATLTTSSSCTAGQDACVNGGFAQCVNGAFVVTQCAGGEVCAALPLVNSPGTSVTCTTTADADSRIAATGATGGLTGA
ncbi:hypothetical protein BT96DRAFT_994188 [Gymnopus androsaceus JB14]|uniref:Carbohydrate-binding module family 19 domain-containing protein n=1 Tax=Gymnopus androsaceus JB14 TaxID=1447944 RepID=A0A6A4HR49_9AGAR|nr:hypothetical protein BT96DRAFT_994188 [Gymnopus androsaceus JB14]